MGAAELMLPIEPVVPTSEYDRGFIDALRNFAWWKDGVQYVGSGSRTLNDALFDRKNLFMYSEAPF